MGNKCIFLLVLHFLFLLPFSTVNASDDDRKGFVFEIGIGAGYTNTSSDQLLYENNSRFGLGLKTGLGYAPTNRSCILFSIKSNVFVDKVASVWKNWIEKMEGDDLVAVGAILVSPFVFGFSPWFLSHSLIGSLEYTHFLKEQSPSFLFSGSVGLGLLYDKFYEQTFGGFGISMGTGYEFNRKIAIHCDLVYSSTENNIHAVSVMVTLNKYFY